jgi:hypothetical protein
MSAMAMPIDMDPEYASCAEDKILARFPIRKKMLRARLLGYQLHAEIDLHQY